MPILVVASAVPSPAAPPPQPVDHAVDLGEPDDEDPGLPDESPADAREAERRAREVMARLDAGARRLVAAALETGLPVAVLVRALLDAAAALERTYRWRDQYSHHADGHRNRGTWGAERKTRHRVHVEEGE